MRATIDTNVWISALVNPAGAPARILAALQAERFTLVTSEPLLAELERVLREAGEAKRTFVFFESPHRVVKTLAIMASALGPRSLVVAREITKVHEEFLRGTPAKLLEHFEQSPPRGELTVVVAGSDWKGPDE